MKVRKKPIVVDAWQYKGTPISNEWPEWIREAYAKGIIYESATYQLTIETKEGKLAVPRGWIVIKGVRGVIYPCDPDIFFDTYEPVLEEQ